MYLISSMIRFHDLRWFLFCTGQCQVQPLGTSEWRHCLCWPPLLGNQFHGLHFQTWNCPGSIGVSFIHGLEVFNVLRQCFPSNCFMWQLRWQCLRWSSVKRPFFGKKKFSTQHEVINTRRTDINTAGFYRICLHNNGQSYLEVSSKNCDVTMSFLSLNKTAKWNKLTWYPQQWEHYICRKQNSLHKSFVDDLVPKLPRTFLKAFFGTLVQPAGNPPEPFQNPTPNLPQSLHGSCPGTICNRNPRQQPCRTSTTPT